MNAQPDVIHVEGLTKNFGSFTAVDRMTFSVGKGEIFGFLGPNGAGKSTTIRMLCGLLEPTAGRGMVGGFDVGDNPDAVKEVIGYMSQRFSLYDDLTVGQNIDFYGGVYGLDGDRLRRRKSWAIDMAGLAGKERVLTRTLPGGWKQRLALGCAILHEPPIVFLDEPTGGVDPVSRRNFWDLIYRLSDAGTTVFVTTHYLDEAEHCARIGLVYSGKLIALGSPTELKHSLDRYTIFDVESDRPVEAMEIIQGKPWTMETSIFGSSFHVSTMGAEGSEEAIRQTLGDRGFALHRVDRISPSLEDVFIHLIAEEDRKEGER
ncbi:MAG: ABC transporter ATP-binding protein [Bacteroidota bacterium]